MTKVATMTSCYRGEKYLKLFLEELPKQTAFDDIELVFNHNCPSPAEIEMINEYKSKYNNLNYTVEEELLPLYESWNKCIEESTSDYICVWNIDDLRTPNSIELMKNTLDENLSIEHQLEIIHEENLLRLRMQLHLLIRMFLLIGIYHKQL